jgi:hypothetical protein
MRQSSLKRLAVWIVLIWPVLAACHSAADALKVSEVPVHHVHAKEIAYWRLDRATKMIILFDDQHHEKYRISTETGRVFFGLREEVEELDLERDGG